MKALAEALELVEREPFDLDAGPDSFAKVQAIQRAARDRVSIAPPNPLTLNKWRLVSEGLIGQIPLLENLVLVIRPKVPVGNLFRMIEVAYQLPGLEFPEGQGVSSAEIEDLFDRLAGVLARRTLIRIQRGLHREYVRYEEDLPYVRGRLLPIELVRRGPALAIPCRFEDQTADISDNQILLWTLRKIARAGLGREETRAQVRKAARAMLGSIQLQPFAGSDCLRRLYQRLNADYRPLHGLCRFFLETLGPTHETGDATMVPFLVDMDRLFELFVAEWLAARLPREYSLTAQEKIDVDAEGRLTAKVDLLIRQSATGRALAVLDTKYKGHERPLHGDLFQINAYADLVGAPAGLLIYPRAPSERFVMNFGGTDVRNLGFDLGGNLEAAGETFLRELEKCLVLAEGAAA